MNGNLLEKQKSLPKKIDRLKQDHTCTLKRMEDELQHAKQGGATSQAIAEMTKRRDDFIGLNEWALKDIQRELDEVNTTIQAEKDTTRKAGRAELDTLKAQARERWLDAGGNDDGFNIEWQTMEREILKQKVMPA